MPVEAGRVLASCFVLAAFAVSVVSGLTQGVDAAQILLRSVLAMIVCFPVGVVVGSTCDRVIRSHLSKESGDVQNGSGVSPMTGRLEKRVEVSPAEAVPTKVVPARAAA